MENKCKVILLPTNDVTHIAYYHETARTRILKYFKKTGKGFYNQHLYILSDDEIKEDDPYIGEDSNIYYLVSTVNFKGKKIIATTNPGLIKEGIASIDDEFVKQYCYNPVEEVLVEYYNPYEKLVGNKIGSNIGDFTLTESSFKPKLSSNGSIIIKSVEEDENTWFNEYQKVEDHIISLLGDKFTTMTLVDGYDSDRAIQMINELVKPVEETWDDVRENFSKDNTLYNGGINLLEWLIQNYETPKKK